MEKKEGKCCTYVQVTKMMSDDTTYPYIRLFFLCAGSFIGIFPPDPLPQPIFFDSDPDDVDVVLGYIRDVGLGQCDLVRGQLFHYTQGHRVAYCKLCFNRSRFGFLPTLTGVNLQYKSNYFRHCIAVQCTHATQGH